MDTERYSRQIRYVGIGPEGQQRIAAAKVAILGLGATGSAVFHALLRAGVGHVRIIDRDWVEWHNLPRQTLYTEADALLQTPKTIAAASHAAAINSAAVVVPLVLDVNPSTITEAIGDADLVIDGSDNIELRQLINAWCVRERRPWLYAGILGAHAMMATLLPDGPCLRCYFPHWHQGGNQPTCETAGVVGAMVQALGGLVASEALKLIAGTGTLNPGLLMLDGWNWSFDQFPAVPRRPDCPICAKHDWSILEEDAMASVALCGRDAVQVRPLVPHQLDLGKLAARLSAAGVEVRQNAYLVRFIAEHHTITVFPDSRAIISGTDDLSKARGVYARWIGT